MTTAATTGRNQSETLFAKPAISAERRADGSIILKSTVPLKQSARCVGDWLEHWARQTPERIFLADRKTPDAPWNTVTYADALRQVRSAAAWILAQGLSAERPLVILSDNSVDHALFALAAQHVGVPSAAISPAYSLMSKDFDKLKGMISLLGARRDLCLQHQTVRGGARGDRTAALGRDRQQRCRRWRCDPIPRDRGDAGNAGRRKSLQGRDAGHDRKVPVHLGFDRHAEGCDQHPAHADLEPAGQGADLDVPRGGARRSRDPRLAAVEPHVWRQPQFQPGAAQWRHALCRRRQARAGAVRDLAGEPAQRDADGVFQRAARFRHADRGVAQ